MRHKGLCLPATPCCAVLRCAGAAVPGDEAGAGRPRGVHRHQGHEPGGEAAHSWAGVGPGRARAGPGRAEPGQAGWPQALGEWVEARGLGAAKLESSVLQAGNLADPRALVCLRVDPARPLPGAVWPTAGGARLPPPGPTPALPGAGQWLQRRPMKGADADTQRVLARAGKWRGCVLVSEERHSSTSSEQQQRRRGGGDSRRGSGGNDSSSSGGAGPSCSRGGRVPGIGAT